jgi:hypothetical protein
VRARVHVCRGACGVAAPITPSSGAIVLAAALVPLIACTRPRSLSGVLDQLHRECGKCALHSCNARCMCDKCVTLITCSSYPWPLTTCSTPGHSIIACMLVPLASQIQRNASLDHVNPWYASCSELHHLLTPMATHHLPTPVWPAKLLRNASLLYTHGQLAAVNSITCSHLCDQPSY